MAVFENGNRKVQVAEDCEDRPGSGGDPPAGSTMASNIGSQKGR